MPVSKSAVTILREEQGTPGGVTYWIRRNDDPDKLEIPLCFRTLNGVDNRGKDLRCNRYAGMGTDHYGTGACRLHGGATNVAATIKHGKQAVLTRTMLQDKIEEFLTGDSSDLSDLSLELAGMRAIFSEFLEEFPAVTDQNYGISISRATKLVAAIGTLLEKISKIENRNTLTAAQAMYLQATVADILLKNISDPSARDRAVKELTNRMSGVAIGDRVSVIQKNQWDSIEETQ
jgi:hypothetical protein